MYERLVALFKSPQAALIMFGVKVDVRVEIMVRVGLSLGIELRFGLGLC